MIKEGLQSVLHISSAHNKGGLPNINIVQTSHFSTFFEWKHWFIRYLVNVNKAFVYITDCNLSLIIHALLNAFFNLKGPNHTHSADKHDKLMDFAKDTFPLAVYGLQDVFIARILLLKVWTSNSNPLLIGRWYMEHLYETKGSMTQARSVDKKCMHSQLGVNHVFMLGCLKILSLPV